MISLKSDVICSKYVSRYKEHIICEKVVKMGFRERVSCWLLQLFFKCLKMVFFHLQFQSLRSVNLKSYRFFIDRPSSSIGLVCCTH